jgi:hypothetical protein
VVYFYVVKTIRTYSNLSDAGFASSLLEAAGIEALLADEQSFTIGYGLAALGLRLQVDDADFERAQRVLDHGPDAAVVEPSEERTEIKGRIPVGLFLACAAVLGVLAFALTRWPLERIRAHASARPNPVTEDENGDGKPDTFYYYEGQRHVRTEVDGNYDGLIDRWYFYDGDGQYVRGERDKNYDGKPDDWCFYEKGDLVNEKNDTDFNGLVDCVTTFANGIATQVDYMPNESKIVTRRQVLKNSVLVEELVDENRDGTFDYKILHDPFGETSKPIPIAHGAQ